MVTPSISIVSLCPYLILMSTGILHSKIFFLSFAWNSATTLYSKSGLVMDDFFYCIQWNAQSFEREYIFPIFCLLFYVSPLMLHLLLSFLSLFQFSQMYFCCLIASLFPTQFWSSLSSRVFRVSVYVELLLSLYRNLSLSLFFLSSIVESHASACNNSTGDILNVPVYILIPFLYMLLSFLTFPGWLYCTVGTYNPIQMHRVRGVFEDMSFSFYCKPKSSIMLCF